MSKHLDKNIDLQEEYFKARKKRNIIQKLTIIVKIICILIILTALVMIINYSIHFVKKSNTFNIDDLTVEGNKYLTFKDILDIIDIKDHDNIFTISLSKLKKKLELHPRIKSVQVKRDLPDKIIITIEERKALVLLNIKKEIGHCLYEIDSEGIVIGEYPNISNYDRPVITGFELENVFLGERLNNGSLLNILQVLSVIEEKYYNFARYIAEVHVNDLFKKPDIIVYLNHFNTKVLFGENFNEDKLNKLNSLLMVIGRKITDLEYINFKYDEAIGKYNG